MSRLKSLQVGFSVTLHLHYSPIVEISGSNRFSFRGNRPMLSALENPFLKIFCSRKNTENGRHGGNWK